jgi:predicted RNA-binding protein (virulence factor B family)
MVTGAIYNYTDAGAFLFSEERYIVFIANKEMNPQSRPKVGQVVTARVTYIRDDGRLNASLKESKEKALITDAEKIMELLHNRNGKMPYSDESSPEVIRDKFGISKAAFKRALGHLLRENRIVEEDGWTYLKEN